MISERSDLTQFYLWGEAPSLLQMARAHGLAAAMPAKHDPCSELPWSQRLNPSMALHCKLVLWGLCKLVLWGLCNSSCVLLQQRCASCHVVCAFTPIFLLQGKHLEPFQLSVCNAQPQNTGLLLNEGGRRWLHTQTMTIPSKVVCDAIRQKICLGGSSMDGGRDYGLAFWA